MKNYDNLPDVLGEMLAQLTESYTTGCPAKVSPKSSDRTTDDIPLGISNRHIHLCQADVEALFGAEYTLTPLKELSQPGQYACKETLTVCGPKGVLERVRILGPVRQQTQVEVLKTDCYTLGVSAPVRMSGDIGGTPGATLVGPAGSVLLTQGVIVAQRHIHMTPEQASHFGVTDGELVAIGFSGLRGGRYENVAVRVSPDFALDCHLDMDEANAMNVHSKSKINLIK